MACPSAASAAMAAISRLLKIERRPAHRDRRTGTRSPCGRSRARLGDLAGQELLELAGDRCWMMSTPRRYRSLIVTFRFAQAAGQATRRGQAQRRRRRRPRSSRAGRTAGRPRPRRRARRNNRRTGRGRSPRPVAAGDAADVAGRHGLGEEGADTDQRQAGDDRRRGWAASINARPAERQRQAGEQAASRARRGWRLRRRAGSSPSTAGRRGRRGRARSSTARAAGRISTKPT